MSQFYEEMASTASSLIAEFGGPIVIARSESGGVHPVTGAVVTGIDSTYTTTGIVTNFSDKMIDGTRILAGDRNLVLTGAIEPLPSDMPMIDGKKWSIVNIKTVRPTSITIVYFVQVRR